MVAPGLEFSSPIVLGFLIPLLGQAAKFIAPVIGRIFGGGSAGAVTAPIARAIVPAARQLVSRAPQALGRIVPTLTKGVGIAGAGAAFETGARLVGGQRGIQVRIGRNGEMVATRRRRINPTNIRALRRAARRIRSFQRATRKVARLVGGGRRVHVHALPRRRRRTWRGDILPFEHDGAINPYAAEDYADYLDEAEDLGFDPRFFQDEEAAED